MVKIARAINPMLVPIVSDTMTMIISVTAITYSLLPRKTGQRIDDTPARQRGEEHNRTSRLTLVTGVACLHFGALAARLGFIGADRQRVGHYCFE